jgi:hypothetical protein
MNKFLQAVGNLTYTENDALTNISTGSAIVDFFFLAAALRKDIEGYFACTLFEKAYAQDKSFALKSLFYIRDIRGGQGERRTFRNILKVLAEIEPAWYNKTNSAGSKNIALIPEFGRWDDLWVLLTSCLKDSVIELVKDQLAADLLNDKEQKYFNISLLAKWLPSENASSPAAKYLAKTITKALGISSKDYRQNLSRLRGALNILERRLSKKEYDGINYEKLPSLAAIKYRKAFARNDKERYAAYLEQLSKGEKKINTAALYPYDLLRGYAPRGFVPNDNVEVDETVEQAWKNLPDYVPGISGLVVADTSGSMTGLPMLVSISLAIYIAERNKNDAWKDYFISFSRNPRLHKITGNNLLERARSVQLGHVANTDIQQVFNLVLDRAVKANVPEADMPKILLIVSDMQFDRCTKNATNLEKIREKYNKAGIPMPKLVFWNVDTRQLQVPATVNDQGVILLSGANPICLKLALTATNEGIEEIVKEMIDTERYKVIEY